MVAVFPKSMKRTLPLIGTRFHGLSREIDRSEEMALFADQVIAAQVAQMRRSFQSEPVVVRVRASGEEAVIQALEYLTSVSSNVVSKTGREDFLNTYDQLRILMTEMINRDFQIIFIAENLTRSSYNDSLLASLRATSNAAITRGKGDSLKVLVTAALESANDAFANGYQASDYRRIIVDVDHQ